jgi:hypothetical protein
VDNPQTILGGTLNARPTRPDNPLSPVPSVERDDGDSRFSETFSEQGHTIHSPPRMPDQPASLHRHMRDGATRADSFSHGSVSGRHMPDDPVITHIDRSNDSGSDHTVEAPRTPMSSHSHTRAVCYASHLFIFIFLTAPFRPLLYTRRVVTRGRLLLIYMRTATRFVTDICFPTTIMTAYRLVRCDTMKYTQVGTAGPLTQVVMVLYITSSLVG